MEKFGDSSWELDALSPTVISGIINGAVVTIIDDGVWEATVEQEEAHRVRLKKASENWEALSATLDKM